jgi:hypothetical protein
MTAYEGAEWASFGLTFELPRLNHTRVLLSLMSQEIVASGKAFEVVAATNLAVEGILGRRLLNVFSLMSGKIFRVEEAFVADGALMRPLRAVQVCLLVAAGSGQSLA